MPESDIAHELRKRLRILTWLTVVMYLVMAGLVFWVRHDGQVKRDQIAAQAHNAAAIAKEERTGTCTLKKDLRQRVRSGEKFLHDNPHGTGGITVAVIQTSIHNAKHTLHSLRAVNCKEEK